jgi:hypothetical protein
MMFLLGVYATIAVIFMIGTWFFSTLGGKSESLFEILFKSLIAGIFWPITILVIKHL